MKIRILVYFILGMIVSGLLMMKYDKMYDQGYCYLHNNVYSVLKFNIKCREYYGIGTITIEAGKRRYLERRLVKAIIKGIDHYDHDYVVIDYNGNYYIGYYYY